MNKTSASFNLYGNSLFRKKNLREFLKRSWKLLNIVKILYKRITVPSLNSKENHFLCMGSTISHFKDGYASKTLVPHTMSQNSGVYTINLFSFQSTMDII